MDRIRRTALMVVIGGLIAPGVVAQSRADPEAAYFRAVAEFFSLPASEVAIMQDWRLEPHEIPVVLFVAGRAGVSPEALAALRRSGVGWEVLSPRYGVRGDALHLPIADNESAGRLDALYARFRETPSDRWHEVALSNTEVITLVNVRLLSQTLGIPPAEILSRAGLSMSFVVLYGELIN